MKKNNLIVISLLGALTLGGGFFAGMKYQQSKSPTFIRQFGNGQREQVAGASRNGFRPISGEILESDDKSITVKLQDGSSKIVLLSDKTEINKAASGSISDLKVGEKVAVFGSDNSDGSVMAQNIQLNPMIRETIQK